MRRRNILDASTKLFGLASDVLVTSAAQDKIGRLWLCRGTASTITFSLALITTSAYIDMYIYSLKILPNGLACKSSCSGNSLKLVLIYHVMTETVPFLLSFSRFAAN